MTAELAGLIFLSLIAINTGISFSDPRDPKSIITIVGLLVVWILLVVGHAV